MERWVFSSCSHWDHFLLKNCINCTERDCGLLHFKAAHKNHSVCHLLDFAWLSLCRYLFSENCCEGNTVILCWFCWFLTQDLCSVLSRAASGGPAGCSPGYRNTFQFKCWCDVNFEFSQCSLKCFLICMATHSSFKGLVHSVHRTHNRFHW